MWHTVRWSNDLLAWQCNGEYCKKYQADGTRCKHTRAVNQVLAARRQRIALSMGGQVPAIVAKMQADEDTRQAEASHCSSQKGNLSGNRGFQLMR